ncbi:unnamed protein product [Linum trigynum]|uniref:Uncharacterized protein n=1 Tax=Linum trigynum TaxID=586398 RepID=A0AAV2ET11_9ROSI
MDPNLEGRNFTTIVYRHNINMTVDAMGSTLGFPNEGIYLASTRDLWGFRFDATVTYSRLSGVDVHYYSPVKVSRLPPHLRVFHYLLTRVLLPRSDQLGVVIKHDIRVIENTIAKKHLNYSHVLFGHMVSASNEHFQDYLPFGDCITQLLANLSINLSAFASSISVTYVLPHPVLGSLGFTIDLPQGGDGMVVDRWPGQLSPNGPLDRARISLIIHVIHPNSPQTEDFVEASPNAYTAPDA